MNPRTTAALAWRAIRSHKLRSTLTALGIVIGIGAVITFVTLGASLQVSIIGEVGAEDADDVYLWAGPESADGQGPGAGAQPVFTARDVAALSELDGVETVIPFGPVATTALTHENDTVSRGRGVVATAPAYVADEELRAGRVFDPGANEAVFNPAAAEQFETPAEVGEEVTVAFADGTSRPVTVVGILNSSTSLSPFEGFGSGPRVYVPTDPFYTTRIDGPGDAGPQAVYSLLVLETTGVEDVGRAKENARAYLTGDSDANSLLPASYTYNLQTSDELLDQLREVLDILTGFVTGIAVISLVVASIGIANIMLVSVTERTREIGIMKAVGAQNRDVLSLFLVESVFLGLIGSVLGIVVGIAAAYGAADYIGIAARFDVQWFGIAVGVGMAVGVVAGLYPAWRAARTDPIEALRYE